MIEIERVYDIGERRMHIHEVADDQRRPLMTAQDACRESPYGGESFDVFGIDLAERRITRVRVITCRLRPVFVGTDRPSTIGGSSISVRSGDRLAAYPRGEHYQHACRNGVCACSPGLLFIWCHLFQATFDL